MSRSQLLKDLVGGKTSIESILMRLKIIMNDLNNDVIINWINGEFEGYNEKSEIPSYRVLKGVPTGTFMVNQSFTYKNSPVPLESLITKDQIDKISTVHIRDGIASIESILSGENRENFAKQVPTAFCHSISNIDLQIAGMIVKISSNQIEGIVSQVKSKLADIIMELEKTFDNLDELDIRPQLNDDVEKKEQVIYNIEKIIYGDSIEVGDKNKINKSRFGNFFGGKSNG
ncbi:MULTISPECIES: hypothetical protein [unclassified Paenibacillus]|uniref:AbiTii domain-containing protein n=1 Tax=unclassified Paenibacillus TaxID=185978 RepID=UPI0024053D00|nr:MULTISPECIES: hypothetical protein [unclassified Paenibacillus]MDF9845395.1 hypothetical protein [Paenibacillus sp. PastF-2]MDF9851979.1 hypothetical protein [Paenibacillus sp. PastM-2]MDF9858536.1 hypothetical protein [Paenibacillus sp. PastF-1]MDH6483802.1 hypothetical protein [Paenibacillus sp. PastH-2]MDH6511175.1 hypothetical protein [Paenibacillus sp. PastM-3]